MDADTMTAVMTVLMALLNSVAWMGVTLLVLAACASHEPIRRLAPARARARS